jgi:uncharacterized protein
MEEAFKVFDNYFKKGSMAYEYLYTHSMMVMKLAIRIAEMNQGLGADTNLLKRGAFLHDIGVVYTNAPEIGCYGKHHYIAHGYLGRALLEKEGLYDVALFCERHVGTGISLEDIIKNKMPLPHRDMLPLTIEEKIVCYADKFYSKSPRYLNTPKSLEKIRSKLAKYGKERVKRFDEFILLFGYDYIYEGKSG